MYLNRGKCKSGLRSYLNTNDLAFMPKDTRSPLLFMLLVGYEAEGLMRQFRAMASESLCSAH
jgi:hypothetical protein